MGDVAYGDGDITPPDIVGRNAPLIIPPPLASLGDSRPWWSSWLVDIFIWDRIIVPPSPSSPSSSSSPSLISSKMRFYYSLYAAACFCSSYFSIRFLIIGFDVTCLARRPFASLIAKSTPFSRRIWQMGRYPDFAAKWRVEPLMSEVTMLICVLLSSSSKFTSWKNPD